MQVSHLAPQKQIYAIKKFSVPLLLLLLFLFYFTWARSRGAFAPKNIRAQLISSLGKMYCVQDPTFKIWLVVLCTTIEMIQPDWLEITDLEKLMIEISLPDNVWIILVYNTILSGAEFSDRIHCPSILPCPV